MKTFFEDGKEKVNLTRLPKEEKRKVWEQIQKNNSVLLDLLEHPFIKGLQEKFGRTEVIVEVKDITRARINGEHTRTEK